MIAYIVILLVFVTLLCGARGQQPTQNDLFNPNPVYAEYNPPLEFFGAAPGQVLEPKLIHPSYKIINGVIQPPEVIPRPRPPNDRSLKNLPPTSPNLKPEPARAADFLVLPPKEYDHDFSGTIYVQVFSYDEVQRRCQRGPTNPVMACSVHSAIMAPDSTCYVYISDEAYLSAHHVSHDAIFRHERAHCLGWHHPRE